MRRIIKRTLSSLLALCMTITGTGIEAFGEITSAQTQEITTIEKQDEEPEIVCELKEERTENSNTYLLENGLKQMVYYTEPIRYEDEEGKLIDYNPELIETEKDEYLYENTAGDSKQYIPQTLDTTTPIVMTNKDYKFSFTPVALGEELSDVEIDSINTQDIYEKEQEMDVIASFRAEENEITYEYQSLQQGIKESIILEKVPENNIFAFRLTMMHLHRQQAYLLQNNI